LVTTETFHLLSAGGLNDGTFMTGSIQLTLKSNHRIIDNFGNQFDKRKRAICPLDYSEPRASVRILAVRDGENKPLYDRAPEGLASPSPTLLIERHSFPATGWQTIVIPHQVISLSLVTSSVEQLRSRSVTTNSGLGGPLLPPLSA